MKEYVIERDELFKWCSIPVDQLENHPDSKVKLTIKETRQEAMKILFLFHGGVSGQETLLTKIYDDAFTDSGTLASWAKAP